MSFGSRQHSSSPLLSRPAWFRTGFFLLSALLCLQLGSPGLALSADSEEDAVDLRAPAVLPADGTTPIDLNIQQEALNITDDLFIAQQQAMAYPDNPEAQFLLAVAYSRTSYLEKALKTVQKTKKIIKNSPEGYKTVDHLIDHYEDILTYRPNDPLVHYRLAFGYYLKGYGIEKNYIKDSPEPADTFYNKAEATMRRTIELSPGDIWARNYLGFLMLERKPEENLTPAIQEWEASVNVESNNPGAFFLLAEAYLKQGNLRKALQYANQALASKDLMQQGDIANRLKPAPDSVKPNSNVPEVVPSKNPSEKEQTIKD